MADKVADASVLAAIAFGEPRAEEAAQLLEDSPLYEPPLLPFELGSVALKKVRAYPAQAVAVLQSLDWVLSLEVNWVNPLYAAVVRLALERGLTFYDACYLAVARQQGASLVTFDARLAAAATME